MISPTSFHEWHFHSEGLENIFHFAICGCTIIGNGFSKVDIHVATQKTT
jgi:hypothetical protein